MRQILIRARSEIDAAIRRLEDMEALFPGVAIALQNVVALTLVPAREKIESAIDHIADNEPPD